MAELPEGDFVIMDYVFRSGEILPELKLLTAPGNRTAQRLWKVRNPFPSSGESRANLKLILQRCAL
jgi:hypothetical protein